MSFLILIVDQIQTSAVISLSLMLKYLSLIIMIKTSAPSGLFNPATDSRETGKEGQSAKVDEQNGDLSVKEEHEKQGTADRMRA